MDNHSQTGESNTLRADVYLLIAAMLRQAPSQELLGFIASLEIENNGSDMSKAWQSIITAANKADTEQLADEYQQLFIGIGRGEVVPFASWHLTGSLMEKPLALIRQDLDLLGFEREDTVKEPEDHMAAICEVMAHLAQDASNGEQESLANQQAFFNRHLSTWFTKFTEQVRQAKSSNFYLTVADLMDTFMNIEKVMFSDKKITNKNKLKIDVKNLIDSVDS